MIVLLAFQTFYLPTFDLCDPLSDEIHMEAAYRHRDLAAASQWHAEAPDVQMMRAEEYRDCFSPEDWAWLVELTMTYLFADDDPDIWENVALAAYVVMRKCTPFLMLNREDGELAQITAAAVLRPFFNLQEFERLRAGPGGQAALEKVMAWLFPPGPRWLKKGTQRTYLVALAYQPSLVTNDGRRMSYEDLARIFERDALASKQARNKARSRWSARAQEVLRKPIEAAGGKAGLHFSKSSESRQKMAASAMGNRNRRGAKAERPDAGLTSPKEHKGLSGESINLTPAYDAGKQRTPTPSPIP